MSVPTFSMLKLAEQVVSSRGAKSCALTAGGRKLQIQPCVAPAPVPFTPSAYDKEDKTATRLTLELRCDAQTLEYFGQFDDWAKGYLVEHSMRLFKKQLTALQVEEGYHPTVKHHPTGAYAPLLRCKIDTAPGRRQVSYWTPENVRREAPEDWSRVSVLPQLEIVSLWGMGRDLGWVIQCNALRVFEESSECPFAVVEEESESMED
jgi:hypothetical protein